MKTSKLLLLGLLVLTLFMGSSAYSQPCNPTLSDSLGPTGGFYEVGETIQYTMSVSVPASLPEPNLPNCTLTNVRVFFFPVGTLGENDNPCDYWDVGGSGAVLIDSGLTLVPGAAPFTYNSSDDSNLQYTVQLSDVGNLLRAKMAIVFDIGDGSLISDECDEKSTVNQAIPPQPCVEVTKDVNCPVSKVGDVVTYEYCIHNCGTIPITIVDLYDTVVPFDDVNDALFAAGCDTLDPNDDLPGGSDECCFYVDYVIQADDPDPLENEFAVLAYDPTYEQFTASLPAFATVDLVDPNFEVTKDCRTDSLEVGDTAIFDIRVENTGDVCLRFDLTELGDPCSFDLAAGDYKEWETHIDVLTEEDIYNDILGTVTLLAGDPPETCGEPNDCLPNEYEVDVNDTCEVGGGASRTPGYWKTHSYMAECLFDMCYPDGIDFGWTDVNDVNELMAVFHASKSKLNKICQARLQLSFHMGAAILNNCLPNGLPFESYTGETFEGLAAIMAGCDVKAITDKIGIVGGYNEAGDDVEIIWPMGMCDDLVSYNATPKVSKEWAEASSVDITMDECEECMDAKVTGKGKGNK